MDKAGKLLKGKPAIDFSFTDMEGNTYRLSDFKGKLLYVDLWATWCGPCIAQSPYFEALSKEYKDKDVVFLAISKDSHKKDLEDYLKSNAKELPQYHSADPSLDVGWEIKGIPRFLLIDKDFNIIDAHASWPSNEKIRELLDEFLN